MVIIAAQPSCFRRTRAVARAAGLGGPLTHLPATFVSSRDVLTKCCPGGYCGKGSRLKPAARAVMDGGMQAHRAAWTHVAKSGLPSVVLEDDVRLLGSADDVAYAVALCARRGCDLAYLGASFEMLFSHAYYLTPHAARRLLLSPHAKQWCNGHKQDYVMRWECTKPALTRLNCTRPPRGLYVGSKPLPTTPLPSSLLDWQGVLGWGLFVQDHSSTPSFTVTIARKRLFDGLNASEVHGLVHDRCATAPARL